MIEEEVRLVKKRIQDSISTKKSMLEDDGLLLQIVSLANDCIVALRNNGKILFAGNGGSFADAQHLAAEFISRFMFDRKPLGAIALGTNNSTFSAIGNDYGYDQVFARELLGIAQPNDVLIAISTSGNSSNIVALVKQALAMNLRVAALTGKNGGRLAERCECLKVNNNETARIQEGHILIGHILCEITEKGYFHNGS